MNSLYNINGCKHFMHNNQLFLSDPNFFPEFQTRLEDFKNLILNLVKEKKGSSFVHFGDGDYFFLKQIPGGSAKPGNRALSVPYSSLNMNTFRQGWNKADYYCVEYLERGMRDKLNELYPGQETIPTEYLYGLSMNKWFFNQFKGKIGLIGAAPKMDIIKNLMKYDEYQNYLGLQDFNDYINIPQKFACDDLQGTIDMVKTQLENANPETRVYLYGVGHVKSGLIHHLPNFKNAIYLDIGAGIDAIAGIIDKYRPYAYEWVNYRMKNYDYSNIDLLNYNLNNDLNKRFL